MTELSYIGTPIDLTKFPTPHYFRELSEFFESNHSAYYNHVMVNGLPVHFDPAYENISINFSGGADSTMLLWILCEVITRLGTNTKIHPTSIVRYFETAQFSEQAKEKTLAYIRERFPAIIGEHIWGFLPTAIEFTPLADLSLRSHELVEFADMIKAEARADILYFRQFDIWARRKYGFQAIYNGTTTNPVDHDLIKKPLFRERQQLLAERVNVFCPFQFIEKSWVTAQYENFAIMDLFDMTQSCEDRAGGCGNCFHCGERQWSLDNKHFYTH